MYSTALDLAKWDAALYGDAVLPRAQLERMWRVDAHRNGRQPLYTYGYGWENNRLRDHRLGHTVAGLIDPDLESYPESIPDSDPAKTAQFREFLDKVMKDGGDPGRLSAAAAARLVPAAMNTTVSYAQGSTMDDIELFSEY